MSLFTTAGQKYLTAMTEWLQDTRLMSEAIFRLYSEHRRSGLIKFTSASWPRPQKGDLPLHAFDIKPVPLAQRMDGLLKSLWRSQFIFLEALWEEYLQDLVLELRHKDASVFEPFCEQKFMAGIVRDVLAGELGSVEEIKDEAAARFAAGITRQPWREQWGQLAGLQVGLSRADEGERWFGQLDVYFEMRNCIIHRQGKVSSLLNQKTDYFRDRKLQRIEIWPQHLDFYRKRFLECVGYIEAKIEAKVKAKAGGR